MKKRLLCMILTLVMIFSLVPSVAAASDEATEAAETLYELGLFKGTGTNSDGIPIFDLDKTPTRNQAIIMLVRLLGKEEEAKAGTWDIPFTDVSDSMKPYIGYAYTNGLTNGFTATTYCGTNPIKANQYIAFVLRSLGYESGKDFEVGTSWKLANDIGLTAGEYDKNSENFTRGDVALISYQSLSCAKKVNPFSEIPAETAKQRKNLSRFQSSVLSMIERDRMAFPDAANRFTLSWEQARALVGKDLATVKRYVKTLGDCLYYLVASDFTRISGDLTYTNGDITWHFNPSAQAVLERNEGNCGGIAGFVACLLEGDYDEVGIVCMRSEVNDGGHVANYLKDGDRYYVFDVNQFLNGYENLLNMSAGRDLNVAVMRSFGGTNRNHPKKMIYTYTGCFDGDEPTGWGNCGNNEKITYIIEGYSSNINIVYETPEEGYVYEFIHLDESVLNKIEAIRNKK